MRINGGPADGAVDKPGTSPSEAIDAEDGSACSAACSAAALAAEYGTRLNSEGAERRVDEPPGVALTGRRRGLPLDRYADADGRLRSSFGGEPMSCASALCGLRPEGEASSSSGELSCRAYRSTGEKADPGRGGDPGRDGGEDMAEPGRDGVDEGEGEKTKACDSMHALLVDSTSRTLASAD